MRKKIVAAAILLLAVIVGGTVMLTKTKENREEEPKEASTTPDGSNELPILPVGEETETVLSIVDLPGGRDFKIQTMKSNQAEAYREQQAEAMEQLHYTVTNYTPVSKEDYLTMIEESIAQGEAVGNVIAVESKDIAGLMEKDYCLNVATVTDVDWMDGRYFNPAVTDAMTFGGSTYGFSEQRTPATGVFFNKSLLEKAGLEGNYPYISSLNNKWNFDTFRELCETLSQKTKANACTGSAELMAEAALLCNDTDLIKKDAEGKLSLNVDDENAKEAITWLINLCGDNLFLQTADDEEALQAFLDGEAAMYIGVADEIDTMQGISFEVGFVEFPFGPRRTAPLAVCKENIRFIPADTKTAPQASALAKAYESYVTIPEGFSSGTLWFWVDARYADRYEDEQAVSQTLTRMIDKYESRMSLMNILPISADWSALLREDADAETFLNQCAVSWNPVVEQFNSYVLKNIHTAQ